MRRTDRLGALLLLATIGVPMGWATWAALAQAFNPSAWRDLQADPQTWPALLLSLQTGLLASALSVLLTAWILSRSFPGPLWARLVKSLGPMLAVPHAAWAIGLAFLMAPSGWLLRAFSPWATGLEAPPPWPTTQDPWGLGLTLALVTKEVPFLLWAAATQLQRPDVALRLSRELLQARTLGYAPQTAWWHVVWPQLLARLHWPMLAVLAYSLTVVDMALVIGPTSPPTLAVLAWHWLQDADLAQNAQGAVAAWLLAAMVAGSLALALLAAQLLRRVPAWRAHRTLGHRGAQRPSHQSRQSRNKTDSSWAALVGLYALVMLALAVGSVAGLWPFPALWPEQLSWAAWASVATSLDTLYTTLFLGLASAGVALLWSLAWLEWAPPRWDAALRRLVYLPLVLPPVLWVVGVHGLTLHWGLDSHWSGLWLAHTLATLPYVLIALSPAYTGFDPRLAQVAASLGQSRLVFLWRVKWPLLRAALAASFAVGFAVSVAQYLPTLFIGGGRYATLTTEAVTLAAGAQRSLTSAYAWLQWLLPVLLFALAARVGLARRFISTAQPESRTNKQNKTDRTMTP